MIKHMLKRQIVEDLLSMTFLINFVLILGAVLAFSLIFLSDFRGQMADYSLKNAKNEKSLRTFSQDPRNANAYANMQLVMKPRAERFISLSYEDKSPKGFYFRMLSYELRVLSRKEDVSGIGWYIPVTTREFISPSALFSPDLTFIVQFLLSFFAVILAFNAVTGEKEAGTLRLIYANPAKRSHFLAIKYISALLTLGLPLLLSLIIAAVMLGVSSIVPLSSGFLYNLTIFALLSLIYLSIFVLIGLLCSTVTRSSKHSLVLGLLFWIFLVVILPKSPGLLLNLKRFDVPTGEQIEGMVEQVEQDSQKKYAQEAMALRNDEEAFMKFAYKVMAEVDEARQGVRDHYLRKKIAAVQTLRKANMVSPASLYEYAASAVAGTGIFHFENFWTQARQYGNGFISFVKQISGDNKPSSPFQFDIRSVTDKPIDYNAIPKFEEKEIRPGDRIKEALPYVALLVLYNLFLFAVVFYKFQNYDVR
jgi:ABC-type transport system involved in multi-copper enzyme maturation permease subunit